MKIEGETTCPHCKKDHAAAFDLEKLEVNAAPSDLRNVTATGTTQQVMSPPEPKIIEKEVTKVVSPSDEPYFACKNGNCDIGMHKNPNYTIKPNKKCKNCDTLNGKKKCKNCGNSDIEEFDELDDSELEDLKIPMPEAHEHDHNHED